jgi:hypothetical protein
MTITSTQLFDFIEAHPVCFIERHEINEAKFDALRISLRGIVKRFSDCDDAGAHEVSDRIRTFLSEWLTVPIPFDNSVRQALQTLGNPTDFKRRWGDDIAVLYGDALESARALPAENPVRAKLRSIILDLIHSSRLFRIYCHRRARPHWESLLIDSDASLSDVSFLHTLTSYRQTDPFEVLLKVGPLRPRGWGSVPDAVISAPRFDTLLQFVWRGCRDEPGFGYDPVAPSSNIGSTPENGIVESIDALGNMITWRTSTVCDPAVDGDAAENDFDDFQLFEDLNAARYRRAAVLLSVGAGHGILFTPRSYVLSFDPSPEAEEPIQFRRPGETSLEGMFVIIPVHDDADLGGMDVRKGVYSRPWKSRLAELYQTDPEGLVFRLRSQGIDLLDLHASIARWSLFPDHILPAPGDTEHFQILIEILRPAWDSNVSGEATTASAWKRAWAEIRHARGEAIQVGRNEHDLIDEELVGITASLLEDIRHLSANNDAYVLPIPSDRGLRGVLRFYRVHAVEDGFSVPETEFGFVQELSTIEQWRV